MRFAKSIVRWLGAGAPAGAVVLGSESVPSGKPDGSSDRFVSLPFFDTNGVSLEGVALTMLAPANTVAGIVEVAIYAYVNTGAWVRISETRRLAPSEVIEIPFPASMAPPITEASLRSGTNRGSADICVLLTLPGTAPPDGQYTFLVTPVTYSAFRRTSEHQALDVIAPIASATPGVGVSCFSFTTSETVVDLWGGATPQYPGYFDRYLDFLAESADCYIAFSTANSPAIDETVAHATSPTSATTTAVPRRLVKDVEKPFRLDVATCRYLHIKGAGTGKLRISPSSRAR